MANKPTNKHLNTGSLKDNAKIIKFKRQCLLPQH